MKSIRTSKTQRGAGKHRTLDQLATACCDKFGVAGVQQVAPDKGELEVRTHLPRDTRVELMITWHGQLRQPRDVTK